MESGTGSQELTRRAAACLTGISSGVSFLVAALSGVGAATALQCSVVAAGGAFVFAMLLAPHVVDVVLSAMARDQAKQQAEAPQETDA
ncbi:MAG TPA: hypothetical protein VF384_11270 [Planctomycetota bacterium]